MFRAKALHNKNGEAAALENRALRYTCSRVVILSERQ